MKFILKQTIFVAAALLIFANIQATPGKKTLPPKGITSITWGQLDGKEVKLFTLTNKNGGEVKITNYGAIITSWVAPEKNGSFSNVVLGFDSLKNYLSRGNPFFGALAGRYANRIGKAKFTLDGTTYNLTANNGPNQLHGGRKGFDKVVWDAEAIVEKNPSITLTYFSKDGEEGYPGNLKVKVIYSLSDANELSIDYSAETDKTTVVNLTQHSYFNLTGDVSNTVLNETLQIDASNYTPFDSTSIPTGEIVPVTGTPFDFTKPHKVGERIALLKGGYDHNFVLNKKTKSLSRIATVTDSMSRRKMEVYTMEPAVQLYTANSLNGSLKNRDGKPIFKYCGLCLETQHFPDSPNKPNFPSTVLKPGEKYHTVTKYKISVF
ncbi:MAG: aldose epimerase family protein [Chitinophagaceae bacterium]